MRAVFFDAGETLLAPDPSFAELFAKVVEAEGVALDVTRVSEVVSASAEFFTELFRSEEGRLWSTSPDRSRTLWDSVYRHFLKQLGVPEEEHERLVDTLYARFSDVRSYRLHDDARPALDALAASGVKLGLISNFEAWLDDLLAHLGVRDAFDVIVISGREGLEKPDPRIFEVALERAGVTAGESVYVGDHPLFDVEGAAAVGMRPVLIDRRGHHDDVDAIRLRSLEDLPAAIGL